MSYTSQLDIISFIPGFSENSTYTTESGDERWEEEGDPLWSAIPYYFPNVTVPFTVGSDVFSVDIVDINTTNLLDNWLTGDMVDESYMTTYADATATINNKYEEDGGLSGPRYRLKNTIEVDLVTDANGNVDENATNISFDGVSSESVLEQEGSNNIQSLYEDHTVPGGYRDRWYNTEKISVNGVDTLRISTVFGGYSQVSQDLYEIFQSYTWRWNFFREVLGWRLESDLTLSDELLEIIISGFLSSTDLLFESTPTIFHFVDYFLSADGAKYMRLWDASLFPKHSAYLDKGDVLFFTDLPWERNEVVNWNNAYFFAEAASGWGPYSGPKNRYLEGVRDQRDDNLTPEQTNLMTNTVRDLNSTLPETSQEAPSFTDINHSVPVSVYGEDSSGEISESEVRSRLPNDILNPFVNRG